jgi:hypothetical protein
MFKRTSFGATLFALAALVSSSAAFAGYSAIAASSEGSSFVSGRHSMEDARADAIRKCRENWGGSCDKTTAEDDSWYFAAGLCDGVVYTAASEDDWGAAAWLVKDKARRDGNGSCHIFAKN